MDSGDLGVALIVAAVALLFSGSVPLALTLAGAVFLLAGWIDGRGDRW